MKKLPWSFFLILLAFIYFSQPVFALVCTSPKKGAVGGLASTGTAGFTYQYGVRSDSPNNIPMLKRGHINLLRANPDPETPCIGTPLETACEGGDIYHCCPAQMIKQILQTRKEGGYWLIFNEPMGEDDYGHCPSSQWPCSAGAAANDAALVISNIRAQNLAINGNSAPPPKFIVGWYTEHNFQPTPAPPAAPWNNIFNQWPTIIAQHPEYGLSTNINNEIAGWHIHPYGITNVNQIYHFIPQDISQGKELWLTEFNTVALATGTGNPCRYDFIDPSNPNYNPTKANTCIQSMTNLLYSLESAESPVTHYFWWYGLKCTFRSDGSLNDGCVSPLLRQDGVTLNNLGVAFAAIPNTNGQCWQCPAEYIAETANLEAIKTYCKDPAKNGHLDCPDDNYVSPLICHSGSDAEFVPFGPNCTPGYCECQCINSGPSPSTPPIVIPGDLNNDNYVNAADYSLFTSQYGTNNSVCDFDHSGTVDSNDFNILKTNYGQ